MDPSTNLTLSTTDYGCCSGCHLVLHDPFIQCHECSNTTALYLCLECFSKGKEFGHHLSHHSYSVVKTNFPVLSPDWNAQEEIHLLNALLYHGHGNWEEISKSVPNKDHKECQKHFQSIFVEGEKDDVISVSYLINKDRDYYGRDQPVPFIYPKGTPIRPCLSGHNGFNKELAGYNAARGDFDWEYENNAEIDLNSIHHSTLLKDDDDDDDDEDTKLLRELEWSALNVYQNKLQKRKRRKRIIKEFGLLYKRKSIVHLPSRYHRLTAAGPKYETLFNIGRIMCSIDLDYLLESLEHEMDVRAKILHLIEYRSNGIRNTFGSTIYNRLIKSRTAHYRDLSVETVNDWITTAKNNIIYVPDKTTGKLIPTTNSRKYVGPLDIVRLPFYDKLTPDERTLCSESRVQPQVYLEIKDLMIAECERLNGLRLADARPVVKIDVNKTRKIYDHLLCLGLIRKPLSTVNLNNKKK